MTLCPNDRSRQLFLQLVALRALGSRRVRLMTNEPCHWRSLYSTERSCRKRRRSVTSDRPVFTCTTMSSRSQQFLLDSMHIL